METAELISSPSYQAAFHRLVLGNPTLDDLVEMAPAFDPGVDLADFGLTFQRAYARTGEGHDCCVMEYKASDFPEWTARLLTDTNRYYSAELVKPDGEMFAAPWTEQAGSAGDAIAWLVRMTYRPTPSNP